MNRRRRKVLHSVLDTLEVLRTKISKEEAVAKIEDCISNVESIAEEEEDSYDSLPESFTFSTTGDNMQTNIDDLYEVSDDLNGVLDILEESEDYCYELVKTDVVTIYNKIKDVIHR